MRAVVVSDATARTLLDFVEGNAESGAAVYTDGEPAYAGVQRRHEVVKPSGAVRPGHGLHQRDGVVLVDVDRCMQELAWKQNNIRDSSTLAQMRDTVTWLIGRNLLYVDLIADNGARS